MDLARIPEESLCAIGISPRNKRSSAAMLNHMISFVRSHEGDLKTKTALWSGND